VPGTYVNYASTADIKYFEEDTPQFVSGGINGSTTPPPYWNQQLKDTGSRSHKVDWSWCCGGAKPEVFTRTVQ
jgi:hypothetical protein